MNAVLERVIKPLHKLAEFRVFPLHLPNTLVRGRNQCEKIAFDRLIDQGAGFAEPELRRPHYLRAQEILLEDLPYISILLKANVAIMPCELEGYRNYPSGELYGVPAMSWGAS